MTSRCVTLIAAALVVSVPAAAQWRAEGVPTSGRVTAIETAGGVVHIAIGPGWYRLFSDPVRLERTSAPARPAVPPGALPDARIATGADAFAHAWLSEPTQRYAHGVLGDAIEAGSLVIERHDGSRSILRLGRDAVFEDIEPRVVRLDGTERIILVKSYLERGSALAVVDTNSASIIAETPPIGRPNAWLNPAGAADFNGDGIVDIALVRQPHVVGRLELWSWRQGGLHKAADVQDVSNHAIGSRALGLSAIADFDGDNRPDLAIPSLDRRSLRLIAFKPQPHNIARVSLPARIATNIGTLMLKGSVALVVGLDDGALVLVHRPQ